MWILNDGQATTDFGLALFRFQLGIIPVPGDNSLSLPSGKDPHLPQGAVQTTPTRCRLVLCASEH